MFCLIWCVGVDVHVFAICRDAFFGTPLDYARMLNIIPNKFEKQKDTTRIHVFNHDTKRIETWSIQKFEETFKVRETENEPRNIGRRE